MPTVLVTGANKGIGLEFVRQYAAKGFKVIAAVRDVTTMPPIEGVQTYKIDATSLTDAHIVAGKLKALGIQIDVLIANAAVNLSPSYLVDIPPATFDLTFKTNVQGPLILFQAMRPLMKYPAKFIVITSGSGTINRKMAVGKGAYGMTKAAINYMANTVRKLHFEHPELLVAALDPGRVHTDGGVKSAAWSGSTNAREPVETPVRKLIQLVDEGDKERLGGWVTTCNGARLDF